MPICARGLKTISLLLILTSVSGCAANGLGDGCSWTRFIYMSKDDKLTERTTDAILAHNETRAKICGGPTD